MQCPRCYFSNPSDSRVCEYCGARLEGTTDVGVDRGSSGQKRKTMLGPMPTMAKKPGGRVGVGDARAKSTPIDPDDPFRIAAQGVRSLPEMDAPQARSVVPSQPPEPRPAKQVRTAMRNSGPQESQSTDAPPEPRPASQVSPPAAPPTPPPGRSRRATVVTLERPEEPSVAGAAIILPATGPARSVLLREGRTRIGRRDGAEIRLDDPKASTDHALLRIEGGEAWLLDTSANGTLVSGTACVNDRADITDGSVLRVGDTLVVLKLLGDDALSHLATEA